MRVLMISSLLSFVGRRRFLSTVVSSGGSLSRDNHPIVTAFVRRWRDAAATASSAHSSSNHQSPPQQKTSSVVADAIQTVTTMRSRPEETFSSVSMDEVMTFYESLDPSGRQVFLETISRELGLNPQRVADETESFLKQWKSSAADDGSERRNLKALQRLRATLIPSYEHVFRKIAHRPQGMQFLVNLRSDLLGCIRESPDNYFLHHLDQGLKLELQDWFSVGFLRLRRIDWNSPASLLEKIKQYEAVHEMREWSDVKRRLMGNDRRCFAFFHPNMAQEPLVFVTVALVDHVSDNVQRLIGPETSTAPGSEYPTPRAPETFVPSVAIFYSITSTQRGLSGVELGNFLIKQVVHELRHEFPSLSTFSTLSPIPGYMKWLRTQLALYQTNGDKDKDESLLLECLTDVEVSAIRSLAEGSSSSGLDALWRILQREDWYKDHHVLATLREPLMKLCARYLLKEKSRKLALDPVANFHVRNGAIVWRLNWLGDASEKGMRQSAGIMVNYLYNLEDIEKNHDAYLTKGEMAASDQVVKWLAGDH